MVGKQREKPSGVTKAALSQVASTAKTAHSTEDRAHRGLQRFWLDCVPMPCLQQMAEGWLLRQTFLSVLQNPWLHSLQMKSVTKH